MKSRAEVCYNRERKPCAITFISGGTFCLRGENMSEASYITEKELNLATKRIDDENRRQNERLDHLERSYAIVNQLSIHMERLASNMESMAKELARQGEKLNDLEMKPAKRWDLVVTTLIAGIIGALVGFVSNGMLP